MPFLDDEDPQQVVLPEEPERPRRSGPERRRQQIFLRRLIATGVGVAFLILLLFGLRSCLEARSDRGLRNYTQSISTTMQESQQIGERFFEAFEGGLSDQELETEIQSARSTSASLYDRAEGLDTPDQMRDAASATTLSLKLRRDAMEQMGAVIGDATADSERTDAIETVTNQMGSLYASDVLWGQLAVPEIGAVLDEEDVDGEELPAGIFMPENDATKFLDQTEIAGILTGVGADEEAGLVGLGLVQTSMGDTTLDPDTTTTVADDAREVTVEVQNQGEADANGVIVEVTLGDQEPVQDEIPKIAPGASEEVNIAIDTLPQPGTEVQLDVFVTPITGESVSDNNQSSYTVIFGTP